MDNSLSRTAPYIIAAPPYVRTSAGVRALYALADSLSNSGFQVYVTGSPGQSGLNIPQLSPSIVKEINESGENPIIVYPETIKGNPLGGRIVVRYLLNYLGFLGGDRELSPDEFVVSWAKGMNPLVDENKEFVLHIPLVDRSIFFPPAKGLMRKGSCFYWGKYKYTLKGKLDHPYRESVEIRRSGSGVQTQHQIAEIFRSSEVFYCYENSMLSLEAMLCGCPVVLMPNEYFDKIIGKSELGMHGMAWGNDPEEMERAKASVGKVQDIYKDIQKQFLKQMNRFAELTQEMAWSQEFEPIRYFGTFSLPAGKISRMLLFALLMPIFVFSGKWKELWHCLIFLVHGNYRGFKEKLIELYFNERIRFEKLCRWI